MDNLGAAARRRLRRLRRRARFGALRRLTPLNDNWGYDRGTPVDRWYIERFLERRAADVRGRVLEVKSDDYARRFGRDVTTEVLDIDRDNPRAGIVADLARPEQLPEGRFDCFVLTQTLQYVPDPGAAVRSCRQVLVEGGVALVTVPAVSAIMEPHRPDLWRFTPSGCRVLFDEVFGARNVEVEVHGNVLTSVAFLHGIAAEELEPRELDASDPRYPVIVSVRAVRA
jgi:SAM-dependent methyltransferase